MEVRSSVEDWQVIWACWEKQKSYGAPIHASPWSGIWEARVRKRCEVRCAKRGVMKDHDKNSWQGDVQSCPFLCGGAGLRPI